MADKSVISLSATFALALADKKLASSGLTPEHSAELGMSVTDDASLLDKQFQPLKAIRIAYKDLDGSDTGFYRLRYLEMPAGFAGQLAKPQRYVQLKGSVNWCYLPHLGGTNWQNIAQDASKPLLITEGEFKAACAQSHGFDTIALGGVTMWQSAKKGISLLPPLDKFNWRGRQATIIFDSDAAVNPQVALASVRLAKRLVLAGALISIASLPPAPDGTKQGLDDFLVAGNDLQPILDGCRPLELGEQLATYNERYAYVNDQDVILDISTSSRYKRDGFVNGLQANSWLVEYQPLSNGGAKRVELSMAKEWLKWPARRDVTAIEYEPGKPQWTDEGKFNSWQGWGCESKKGDITPWKELLDFLFEGAPQEREWFERWCACPIQSPGEKMYTAALIWGPDTGTGKSLVGITLGRIYGDTNFTIVENADLFAAFNEWACNKQFVLGDEISGSDKRSEADKLKSLITRPKVRINKKHLPTYEVRDCINYYFTSNHADGLFLEDKDRRMFIRRAPTASKPRSFYINYMEWLDKKGGKEALFYHLSHLDLGDFDPGAPALLTESKIEMVDHAKSAVAAFIKDLQHNTEDMLKMLAHQWQLKETPDIVLNKHLLMLYDPESKTKVTAQGIGRILAAANYKSFNVNRTAAFGTQRFYVIRNADKWLNASQEEIRAYIDSVYQPSAIKQKY